MPLASDAQGDWSIVTSPNTSDGQTTNLLPGVTCVSTSNCWAVGYYDTGNTRYQTLIQHWDGVSWARVASPNTGSTEDNLLQAVTCVSTSDCWAVGYSRVTSQTLIEHWNGTEWTIVSSPNTSAAQRNYLYGVTCASASDCWAVGYYLGGSTYQTLAARWDGTSWTIAPSPNISPTQHHRLLGVTCASASNCWAVGYYTAGVDERLIERWDGTAWAIDTSPNTNATADNQLHSVTCVSASDCWAVGNYNGYSNARTLVERWNGTVWVAVASPSPSGTQNNFLTSVTCASASDCWAAGNNYAGSASHTIIERWDGTSWTLAASPNTGPTQQNFLTGVACASSSDCWAIGNYYIGSAIYQTLIERWDGTSWTIVTSPNAGAAKDNVIAGVTCVTASDCWAVGYGIVNTVGQTLIQRWDGTSWTIFPSPNPIAAKGGSLSAVTCLSETDCWAVGGGPGSNFYGQTLTLRWDGTSWSVVPSANTSATQNNTLFGVTCASASDCWAVGTYTAAGADQTLIEHWDGTSWTIVSSPNISPTQGTYLNGVTCASASECWAVGYARDFSAPPQVKSYYMIIARWNGTLWALDTSPNANATHNQLLRDVTCVSASDCWAVGFDWAVDDPYYHTLIERWNGTAWAIVASPNTSATDYNLLSGVTCVSASDCWAVGNASVVSAYQTLIEHWDGTAWAIVLSSNTSATQTNVLSSVSCAAASDCWAVGNYNSGTAQRTLTEHYTAISPLTPTSVVSRKTHETGSDFDIDLPLAGGPGIECRSGGASGDHQVVITFPSAVTFASATVSSGAGAVASSSGNGTTAVTVSLTGVTNAQTITITLSGTNDGTNTGDVDVRMAVLLGDTTANGTVNSSDIGQAKANSGQTTTSANFRTDVIVNGTINSSDIGTVKANSGTSLP